MLIGAHSARSLINILILIQRSLSFLKNSIISKAGSAITSKELSLVKAENITVNDNKKAFEVYWGKDEYGPAQLEVKEFKSGGNKKLFTVDSLSTLILNGEPKRGKGK